MKNKLTIRAFGFMCLMLVSFAGTAQKKKAKTDALMMIRDFVQMGNWYKQLPVSLKMEMQQSITTFKTETDSTVYVELYVNKSNCYMRSGETEKLINDSLTLVVSNQMQRMFLYQNSKPVEEYLKAFGSTYLSDSSIEALNKKYSIKTSAPLSAEVTISLEDKTMLGVTSFPKETIELTYTAQTTIPVSITAVTRSLIPLDEETYKSLSNNEDVKSRLINNNDKAFFLVKEVRTFCRYKEIVHDAIKFPASVQDRITKNKEGEYVPVKSYGAYTVTIN